MRKTIGILGYRTSTHSEYFRHQVQLSNFLNINRNLLVVVTGSTINGVDGLARQYCRKYGIPFVSDQSSDTQENIGMTTLCEELHVFDGPSGSYHQAADHTEKAFTSNGKPVVHHPYPSTSTDKNWVDTHQ